MVDVFFAHTRFVPAYREQFPELAAGRTGPEVAGIGTSLCQALDADAAGDAQAAAALGQVRRLRGPEGVTARAVLGLAVERVCPGYAVAPPSVRG